MKVIKRIALCGLLSALALLSFMLENLFPPIFIVGGRIGISNVFILLAGILSGFLDGLSVIMVKTVLGSVFSGNVSATLYSLPAGVIAYVAEMSIIYYARRVSVIAASVTGGALNAAIQNAVFCLITATPEYFYYLPYLVLIGAAGGAVVGTAVFLTVKFLPDGYLYKASKEKTS